LKWGCLMNAHGVWRAKNYTNWRSIEWAMMNFTKPIWNGNFCIHALCSAIAVSTTQAILTDIEAPEHLAAFLYVSLGMGSSRNQPAMVSGLSCTPSCFNNSFFGFLSSFTLWMDHIDVHVFKMLYNQLCFEALVQMWWKGLVSNIIYLCNGHITQNYVKGCKKLPFFRKLI